MKEKIIEEMAKTMCNGCIENELMTCTVTHEEVPCCFAKQFAEALYNAGYRKIPEIPKNTVLTNNDIAELLSIVARDTRKKTAKKFAEKARLKTIVVVKPLNGVVQIGSDTEEAILLSDLDEIAKEITEGE